jgi:hypothetical protein
MIIIHIAHDHRALKECSLTCHSWYIAALPHLHHTVTLTGRTELKPLYKLRRLGLAPLVKEIQVVQTSRMWFVPWAFDSRDFGCFSDFANVQTLTFECLEISLFMPDVERYFGHFPPTLRSLTLSSVFCTPRHLSHFLSLFPNLDDIAIWQFSMHRHNLTAANTKFVPFPAPRLRGRLALRMFDSVETWTDIIDSGGSLQFHCMDLWMVGSCALVLFEACAKTVETLRFYAADALVGE